MAEPCLLLSWLCLLLICTAVAFYELCQPDKPFHILECGKWLKCYTVTEKMLFPIVSCCKLSFRNLWLQLYREKKFIWEWRLVVFDQEIYGVLHIWHNVHWPMFSLFHCQGMFCSVKRGIGNPFWVIFPGQTLHKCVSVCVCNYTLEFGLFSALFFFFCLIFFCTANMFMCGHMGSDGLSVCILCTQACPWRNPPKCRKKKST